MAKKKKPPCYSLERVKSLVSQDEFYVARTTGLDFFDINAEGTSFAKRVAEILTEDNYSATVQLEIDVADVYAIRMDGTGWYIKIYIDEDVPETVFVSLHPLDHPIRTNSGRVKP